MPLVEIDLREHLARLTLAARDNLRVILVEMERRFIGIEIVEHWFNAARERIENAQRQQRMFA